VYISLSQLCIISGLSEPLDPLPSLWDPAVHRAGWLWLRIALRLLRPGGQQKLLSWILWEAQVAPEKKIESAHLQCRFTSFFKHCSLLLDSLDSFLWYFFLFPPTCDVQSLSNQTYSNLSLSGLVFFPLGLAFFNFLVTPAIVVLSSDRFLRIQGDLHRGSVANRAVRDALPEAAQVEGQIVSWSLNFGVPTFEIISCDDMWCLYSIYGF